MQLTREEKLFQQVVQESWENESFKQELMDNPLAAIEKLTGERLIVPEGKTLVVKDQTNEDTVYLNIPAKPNMENVELNEKQLEAVAGGKGEPVWDFIIGPNPIGYPVILPPDLGSTGPFAPNS